MPESELQRLAAALLALGFPAILLAAALRDMARRRIDNGLSLALALLYPPAALLAGADPGEVAWHLGAGGATLAGGLALAAAGLLGGGDGKLLAAAACWTGFAALPALLVAVALAGGALALVSILVRAVSGRRAKRRPGGLADMPYGPAIALGGVAVWPRIEPAASLFGL